MSLFHELERHCPDTWGRLPLERKRTLCDDFEAGMVELWNTPSLAPTQLFIDMGLYFARFEPPRNCTDCYSRLVIAFRARRLLERVALASLNYDCVLDCAASRAGLPLAYLSDDGAPPAGNLLILKPHGACNLIPDANVANLGMVAAGGQSGFYDGQITVAASLRAVHEQYAQGFALPPVMSMYTRDKHSPVGGTFLRDTRDQWARWVRSSSAVLCVGARPVPWDEHIWRPILERNTETWFVGGQDDSYDALAVELGNKLEYLGPTFDGSLTGILSRLDRVV